MRRLSFCSLFLSVSLTLLLAASALAAELHLYAGAGLKNPTDVIVARFEAETGAKVNIEYAGMGQLLTRYQSTRAGDVFLSGSQFYVEELKKEGLVTASHELVFHTPVMVVRKDRAQGINTLEDLAKSNLRIATGDPEAIALGKGGQKLMEASGYGDELKAKVAVMGTTIKQVLLYVTNGDVDAAIIGRSDAINNPDLVILPTPKGTPEEISVIAGLTSSKQPELTQKLVDHFASPESVKTFVDFGFLPVKK